MGPARNGSAVASRPSLPLSRTCHKGVAPPPPPPPPSGGPGSWRKSVPQPSHAAPGSPWGRGVGGTPGLGTSVREGNSRPSLRRRDRTGAGGGSEKGPGRGWRWAKPRKQPRGPPARAVLKAPGEVSGRGCSPFRGFLTEEVVGGRPSEEAAAKGAQVRSR